MVPLASNVMSVGPLNCADVPIPLAPPAVPLPANVDTTPEGRILRTRWLITSATYTLPRESAETPLGSQNEEAVPRPFAKAAVPEPAKVVTAPKGVIRRTRWPPQSPTNMLRETGSTDTPCGLMNAAAVPCPSAHPAVPLPASVLTFQ
jgi:hypothetical protein